MDSIKVIGTLSNKADYEEYTAACLKHNVPVLSLLPYSHTMGMMLIGMHKYPGIEPYEAFIKIQQEANEAMGLPGCSTCNDKKDKPLPSIASQAKNLITGVGHHIADGMKNVDDKTLEIRNKICNDCENMRSDGRCAKCGCFMKVKAKWESAKCPIGKW